jgi:very-short-patch-repair endonuclease
MSKPSWDVLRQTSEPPHQYAIHPQTQVAFYRAMGEWIEGDAHGFWLEPETGDGHCDPSAFVVTIGERLFALSVLHNGPALGSPIEGMLGAALLWLEADWAGFPRVDEFGGFESTEPTEHLEFFLTPQAAIAGYKVDFMLWFQCGRHRAGVAVECDGHDFHERTKEQAARDKKRDREILTAGYPVLRFTGSEVFANPTSCADQVKLALSRPLEKVTNDADVFGRRALKGSATQ